MLVVSNILNPSYASCIFLSVTLSDMMTVAQLSRLVRSPSTPSPFPLLSPPSPSPSLFTRLCLLLQSMLCGMQEMLVVNEQTVFGDVVLRLIGRNCPDLR